MRWFRGRLEYKRKQDVVGSRSATLCCEDLLDVVVDDRLLETSYEVQ
jgi:hypothetical protein